MRAESVDGVEEVVTQWARGLHVEHNMQARIAGLRQQRA